MWAGHADDLPRSAPFGGGQLLLQLLQIIRPGNDDAAISVQTGYNRSRNARKAVKKANGDLESRLEDIKAVH